MLPFALFALAHAAAPATAQTAGSIVQAGDTLVSAMMMFLGNDQKVYIMDKVEGNKHQINGHSAYAAVWCACSRPLALLQCSETPIGTLQRKRPRPWTSRATPSARPACIFPTARSQHLAGTARWGTPVLTYLDYLVLT
jgi:hypothetical protein